VSIAIMLAAHLATPGIQSPVAPAMDSAFAAAFSASSVIVNRPATPRGFNGTLGSVAKVTLRLTPEKLVELGSERYALVVRETDELGSHVDPGAVGLAYLRREGSGWKLERVWREYAWTGNTGHPADTFRVARRGRTPLLAWTSQQTNQGDSVTYEWVVELRNGGPRLEGHHPSIERSN
jgi:hypothetical protein